MRGILGRFAAILIVSGLVGAPSHAAEPAEDVTDDVLEILRERGIIDDGEYQRLAAKNARYEQQHKSWVPEIDWSGDFRFRHESFWFDRDETGVDRDNRYRLRYRLRLKGEIDINEWADVVFRLASGTNDHRSTNQTLGSVVDFDTDDIRLDLGYARLTAPSHWVPLPGGKAVVELGKLPNPFRWKIGKDYLWDGDITLEGASLKLEAKPAAGTELFAHMGYYIDDENGTRKDPHLWALQIGGSQEASEDVTLGARATWYEFRSIDLAFNLRGATGLGAGAVTSGGGNIPDGLNGDITGEPFSVVEAAGYVKFSGVEGWPILLYGEFFRNLGAESSQLFPGAGDEDTGWAVGLEVGDKKRYAKVGTAYWYVEANAFPALFVDSDLHDGRTNREGWVVYGSRQVLENTDFNLTLFISDEIEDDVPPFGSSVPNAERVRLQTDLVFKF